LTDQQWLALCGVIGRPDLAGDPELKQARGRLRRQNEVEAAVGAWTASHDAFDVMQILQKAGVPAGVVENARELIEEDRQLRERGYWQEIDHPEMGVTRFTSPPYLVDGERVELKRPPLLGEHTDAVLGRVLGYSGAQIDELRAAGVLK
jgi:benzylsuccinate CoA-transferase BbsF subunit